MNENDDDSEEEGCPIYVNVVYYSSSVYVLCNANYREEC